MYIHPENFHLYPNCRSESLADPYFPVLQFLFHLHFDFPDCNDHRHPVQSPALPLRNRTLQYSFLSPFVFETEQNSSANTHTKAFFPRVSYSYAILLPGEYFVCYTASFSLPQSRCSRDSPLVRGGLFLYLTKLVDRVQLQASLGFRIAAAGFSSHLTEPFSGLGRLCQGSMQTNLGIPGLLQMRV